MKCIGFCVGKEAGGVRNELSKRMPAQKVIPMDEIRRPHLPRFATMLFTTCSMQSTRITFELNTKKKQHSPACFKQMCKSCFISTRSSCDIVRSGVDSLASVELRTQLQGVSRRTVFCCSNSCIARAQHLRNVHTVYALPFSWVPSKQCLSGMPGVQSELAFHGHVQLPHHRGLDWVGSLRMWFCLSLLTFVVACYM